MVEPDADAPRRMPHIYALLAGFIGLAAVATHLLPAGAYTRTPGPNGRITLDASSYRLVEGDPASLLDLLLAIPKGLSSAREVVFFTLMIGGMFAVLRRAGVIELGVRGLSRRFARHGLALLAVLMVAFGAIATLIGTQELSLVYVPVILPVVIALGFDSVTAAGVALCATTAGFMSGVLNPINTGLGQQLSGLPLYSGAPFRAVAFVALLAAAMGFVLRYARRLSKDPEGSFVADLSEEASKRALHRGAIPTEARETPARLWGAVAVAFALGATLVWGILAQRWFMNEMSGMFIVTGAAVGLVAGLGVEQTCRAFDEGFREVLAGALIAGVARGVAVVLEDGLVLDTLIHGLGTLVGGLPTLVSAVGMYFCQLGFNFVVPSGSGQALVTMPIMAPLADLLGVTRQTAVLAYQLGDGAGNILYPTSGYFMATLGVAGVPWERWVRFFLPIFFTWMGISVGLLAFAQATGWTG